MTNKVQLKVSLYEDLFAAKSILSRAKYSATSGSQDPIQAGLATRETKILDELIVLLNNRIDHLNNSECY